MTGLNILSSPEWKDYELLDSGGGMKLERYGKYKFCRPEPQAMWQRSLPQAEWDKADAIFQSTNEESGGRWTPRRQIAPQWEMRYKDLAFYARTSNSRHLGVFPEQAAHWDWVRQQVEVSRKSLQVLNLFGYTGIATLAAAKAGARVTHVDASKKSIQYAKENQELSGLTAKSIRWIVDDAVKFVKREARRGARYEGIILDPPKFGRGPKGEVWEFFNMLPYLLEVVRPILADEPKFLVITAYAIRASALSLHYSIREMMDHHGGRLDSGELVLAEKSAGRILSMAIYSRWTAI